MLATVTPRNDFTMQYVKINAVKCYNDELQENKLSNYCTGYNAEQQVRKMRTKNKVPRIPKSKRLWA
jgi:hypothetical protein